MTLNRQFNVNWRTRNKGNTEPVAESDRRGGLVLDRRRNPVPVA